MSGEVVGKDFSEKGAFELRQMMERPNPAVCVTGPEWEGVAKALWWSLAW